MPASSPHPSRHRRGQIRDLAFRHADKPGVGFEIFRLADLYRREARGLLPNLLQAPQRPDFHTIYVGISGRGQHLVDFTPRAFGAGTLTVVARGRVQAFSRERKVDAWMLLFAPEFLPGASQVLAPTMDDAAFPLHGASRKIVIALCEQLHEEQRRPLDAQQPAVLAGLLQAVVAHTDRIAAQQAPGDRPVMPAALAQFFTIVERDHARSRSVAHHASAAGISPRRLGELLEAQGKPSAKQIICERVVLEQKRRLAHSDISIKELAAATGFDEPTNMVKFFRHYTGTTPIAFRALHRADRRFLPFRRGF